MQDDVVVGGEDDLVLAAEADPASARTCSTIGSAATGSTRCGSCPARPSTTAFTLPWPCPVAPSEPNSSTRTDAVRARSPEARSRPTKRDAARIGPTVCELDGPMPTLNMSNTEMLTVAPIHAGLWSCRRC